MQSASTRHSLQWLRLPDLITRRRRSRSATYRDIEHGLFPPPVRLGANSSVWPEFEVDAIDRARLAGATDDDIRTLVAQLIHDRRAAA